MHEFVSLDGVIDAPAWTSTTASTLAACESCENGVVYLAYRPQA